MLFATEEALADRIDIPQTPILSIRRESVDIHRVPATLLGHARVVARRLAMVILAAFAILVLLPAALAAEASVPI